MRNKFRKVKRNGVRIDPIKADPSLTSGIRRAFEAALRLRIDRVISQVWKVLDTNDALGLKPLVVNELVHEDEFGDTLVVNAVEPNRQLNKPFRTPGGPKKFAVYVTGPSGKPVIVRFGDPNMKIKRDDPERRKNFRARHNCDNPGPKWKAKYWACRFWEKSKSVGDLVGNVFCPTGEGGGIDPTCKPGGTKGVRQKRIEDLKTAAASIEHTTLPTVDRTGATVQKGKWGKDLWQKGHAYSFDTSTGNTYEVSIQDSVPLKAGVTVKELVFYDHEGGTDITGAGGAVEVFRKVSTATLAYVLKHEPPAIMYTAAEESRVKLYDRLTSTLGVAAPEYVAFAAQKGKDGGKRYLLIKEGLKEYAEEFIKKFSPKTATVEKLTGNAIPDDDWVFVDLPPFDPDWFDDEPTTNTANWRFGTSDQKVEEFQKWLAVLFNQELTGADDRSLWTKFVTQAFEKGIARSFDDYMKTLPGGKDEKAARKAEFLRASLRNPVAIEKVKLLASRTFSDLQGVTQATGTAMTRVLAEGLARGDSPRVVALKLHEVMGTVTKARALTIARTETIRAHAEGQLVALKDLGVKNLGVQVEWDTAGDGKVCQLCRPMEGLIVPIEKASGMLPRHPNCRCAWKPYVPVPEGFSRVNGKLVANMAEIRRTQLYNRVYALIVNDKGANCGIGSGGFTKGNKCGAGGKGGTTPAVATPGELKKVKAMADARVAACPIPLKKRVQFNRVRLNRFAAAVKKWDKGGRVGNKPKLREFLDLRGNTKQREARREKLFNEFGGGEKGYVVCHGTGLKMHYTDDPKKNPNKYPLFEEGKIFTAYQGGKYDLSNLLPESAVYNRSRGDAPVRKENMS